MIQKGSVTADAPFIAQSAECREMEDNLRGEYDLQSLKIRRLGSGRKNLTLSQKVSASPQQAAEPPNSHATAEPWHEVSS